MSKIPFSDILCKKRICLLHQLLLAVPKVHFEIFVKQSNVLGIDFWHGMIESLHMRATIAFPSVKPVDHTPFSQTNLAVGQTLDLLPWMDDIVGPGSSMSTEGLLIMTLMNTDAA
jgi:hypothetical protein